MTVFARFFHDRKGGVAPLLAICIVPLVTAAGAAIDYSRAGSVRTSMQAAGDATALMLAKGATGMNPTQLQASASAYFQANFHRSEAINPQVTANFSQGPNGMVVTVNGSANVRTLFMGMVGFPQISIETTGTVNWNNSKLRVALVLDNTGSMSSAGKLTALKSASHNLLTQLQSAAQQNGDVLVSIIPFVKDINMGASNYNANWIDWTDWDAANGTCSNHTYTSKSTCQSHNAIWTPKNHNTWNGCITDRDQNFDTLNTAPTVLGGGSAKFPAEQYSSCPVEVMGLSYDWSALNAKIDAMVAAGNTNQAIGLALGWQSLTNAPFTVPAKDPNYQYQDIIILLTDGLNTQDRWYTTAAAIDNRQAVTCNNIKNAGITLYTVQVNTGGDPTSTLLENCASSSDKFFLLTSASQIVTTFGAIGTQISKLHVSN